jgi:hypothetical protein
MSIVRRDGHVHLEFSPPIAAQRPFCTEMRYFNANASKKYNLDEADDLLNGTDGLSKGAASWTIPTAALKDTSRYARHAIAVSTTSTCSQNIRKLRYGRTCWNGVPCL